jgi:hypothetical protein
MLWPALTICMDLGADGYCGINGLIHLWLLNVICWPDGSHGANRDFVLFLNIIGLKNFWILMCSSWNLPHGNEMHKDGRHWQMRKAMEFYFATKNPRDAKLFLANCRDMKNELVESGVMFAGVDPIEVEVFQYLKSTHPFAAKDRKCSFSRFLSVVSRPLELLKDWAQDRFARTYTAIECDFLRGKKFSAAVSVRTNGAELVGESGAHTSSKVLDIVDRSVRDSCANVVSLSVMMLSKDENKRLCNVTLSPAKHLKKWEGQGNAGNRSAPECERLAMVQATGGYMEHLNDMVKALSTPAVLEECGFETRPKAKEANNANELYLVELEFADMLGGNTFVLIGLRLRRGIFYMVGWPHSMSAVLKNDAAWDNRTMLRFARDRQHHQLLKDKPHPSLQDQVVLKGDEFNTTAVMQYVEAFKETADVVTTAVRAITSKKVKGPLSTVLIEEINGVQKNRDRAKHSCAYRRPEACMAVTLQSGVISEKHRYTSVSPDLPVKSKMSRLPQEAFDHDIKHRSLPYSDLVGHSPVKHYSPQANNNCVNVSHHQLLADSVAQFGEVMNLDDAWQGVFLEAHNRLCIRTRKLAKDPWAYYYACSHFETSTCNVWPCALKVVPGHDNEEWFELETALDMPHFYTVFDMKSKHLEVCRVQWKAPYNMFVDYPNARGKLPCACVPFRLGVFRSLCTLGAYCAYWNTGRTTVEDIADCIGLLYDKGDTTFQLLFKCIKHTLKFDDTQILNIMYEHRIKNMTNRERFAQEVMLVDEAFDVLEDADKRVALKEQIANQSRADSNTGFRFEYHTVARKNFDAIGKGGAAAKKKAKLTKFTECFEEGFDIGQPAAKHYLPPACSVWRMTAGRQGWAGQMEKNTRLSEPFDGEDTTCRAALQKLLKRIWDEYLFKYGKPPSACPFDFSG